MSDSTKPRQFVFVLMPFDSKFDDVYKVGIKPAVREAGGYCERLDEQIFESTMLERIYNQISKADLIVADMTGRNPNVFYEVGYAHALGKKVVLLTRVADDIPFDLKHFPHIVYGDSLAMLGERLRERARWYLAQDQKDELKSLEYRYLQFFISGNQIKEGANISLSASDIELPDYYDPDQSNLTVDISLSMHNPTEVTRDSSSGFALILPEFAVTSGGRRYSEQTRMPDRRVMVHVDHFRTTILPFMWSTIGIQASIPKDKVGESTLIPVVLRFFTPLGVEDTNFVLELPPLSIVDGQELEASQ